MNYTTLGGGGRGDKKKTNNKPCSCTNLEIPSVEYEIITHKNVKHNLMNSVDYDGCKRNASLKNVLATFRYISHAYVHFYPERG